jgi:hypothetical protein
LDAKQTSVDVPIPNQIETQRQTVQPTPPPAHPFSQHGMHLSKIPQRWKRRIGHSPIPRFREAGRRRPNIQVESGSSKPLVRTGTAEPNRLFSLPFSPPPRRFVKRRPVGGAGYSGLTPINATPFLLFRLLFSQFL